MTDRRSFVAWLGSLTTALRWPRAASPTPVLRAVPTALYRQPDGRSNLVRVTVTGLDAPAARARLTDRRGALVGTAWLLPDEGGTGLAGEVWVPLAEPVLYQIDLEVGKQRVVRQRVRLVPPRRWTLYWIASSHTDLGLTDLRERCVEAHRRNLDAALARLPTHPDFRWTAECALPAVSYVENREPAAGDALVRASRDGKIGFTALFANLLTGLLDHETLARAAWPAGLFAREHGLGYAAALMADGPRLGFDVGPAEMAHHLTEWLLSDPVLGAPGYPYDVALLWGAAPSNALVDERVIANVEEFNRLYTYPRLLPARPEDFFRDVERRYGPKLPVRRGDTGCYREDGAASTARDLARYRAAQLSARAAELLALWDEKTEPPSSGASERIERRAEQRRQMWRDLLVFGEHTWGAATSVSDPDGEQTTSQWASKRRVLERAADTADAQVAGALLRIGLSAAAGAGRVVFNASSWTRSDVLHVPDGAGRLLRFDARDWPAVDLPDGSALIVAREVPPLGYVVLAESDGAANPPRDEGATLEAQAGSFHVVLDPASGAIRSLTAGDGKERVRPGAWSGLNQLVYVRGGGHSALWTDPTPDGLRTAADLTLSQAELASARREGLPGIGERLLVERRLQGCTSVATVVTLYDELPWVDIENRISKPATLEKEALYVAFPFALTKPTVDVEVPLGRMTVERDQQAGSGRDWYSHAHWVWLRDAADGMLWSGPDTPLVTLNDIFRGQWRRRLEPDGTLFAYVLHNYWPSNFAARQGGDFVFRFRISALAPGSDRAEPVRRGWAACDPLYVGTGYTSAGAGPLPRKDSALAIADPGVVVVGAKPADDGTGAVVKLLDVAGSARTVGVWPAAYTFRAARRANFVEMTGDALPLAADGHAAVDLPAWGAGALRLFTPPPRVG